jgi:hypothetical protein
LRHRENWHASDNNPECSYLTRRSLIAVGTVGFTRVKGLPTHTKFCIVSLDGGFQARRVPRQCARGFTRFRRRPGVRRDISSTESSMGASRTTGSP